MKSQGTYISAFYPITNAVGYAGGATGANNNFVTVPFASVGYNTSDIQQLKISGDSVGWGSETFGVWEGLPTVVEGSAFVYWDASMDPLGEATECYWADEGFNRASFSIAPGQAVVIDCAEDLTLTTAGQVSAEDVSFTTIAGNNFTGNPFPAPIDIQAIKISGESVGWGSETFGIWEGLPTVKEGSAFVYWAASMDPTGEATECYWADEGFNKVSYSIPSGQGVVLDCAEGLTVTIDAPFSL